MKIDPILKEELWRSVVVYWISFIGIGCLIMAGYLPVPLSYTFCLALIPTAAYVYAMVWYRRKEGLTDPFLPIILDHALRGGKHGEERRVVADKAVDTALAAAIFLIYLYMSLANAIDQIFWLPVLLVIGLLLMRIVFIDGGERCTTVARMVVFYLIAAAIFILRYLALGYPVVPHLQAIALIGIVSFPILYIWERRHVQKKRTDG